VGVVGSAMGDLARIRRDVVYSDFGRLLSDRQALFPITHHGKVCHRRGLKAGRLQCKVQGAASAGPSPAGPLPGLARQHAHIRHRRQQSRLAHLVARVHAPPPAPRDGVLRQEDRDQRLDGGWRTQEHKGKMLRAAGGCLADASYGASCSAWSTTQALPSRMGARDSPGTHTRLTRQNCRSWPRPNSPTDTSASSMVTCCDSICQACPAGECRRRRV